MAVGDVLAEVETDKAVMELVARAGGTLLKQVVPAGTTVPVSELVALIGEPGEAVENGKPARHAGSRPPSRPRTRNRPDSMPPAPPAQAATEAQPAPRRRAASRSSGDRCRRVGVRADGWPGARRRRSLDGSPPSAASTSAAIAGTGPEGRVVLRDLEGAPAAGSGEPLTAATAGPPCPAASAADGAPYTDVPLSQIRKTIARRLAQSIGPIPTFYLTTEVDMERAWDAREALKALGEAKVSFNDIIIKAVATALRQHPACNAWWQDDHIRYWHEVHVSMAVAIDEGLITPVIRHADLKSLREIAAESQDLAGARPRAPADARGVHRRHVLRLQPRACSTSTSSRP